MAPSAARRSAVEVAVVTEHDVGGDEGRGILGVGGEHAQRLTECDGGLWVMRASCPPPIMATTGSPVRGSRVAMTRPRLAVLPGHRSDGPGVPEFRHRDPPPGHLDSPE